VRLRIRNFLDGFGLLPLYGFLAFIIIYDCCYAQFQGYDGQILNPSAPAGEQIQLHKLAGFYTGSNIEHPFVARDGFQFENSEYDGFSGNPTNLPDQIYAAGIPVMIGDITGDYGNPITLSNYPNQPTGMFLRDINAPVVDDYIDENGNLVDLNGYQFFELSVGGQMLSYKPAILSRMTEMDHGYGNQNNDETTLFGMAARTAILSGITYFIFFFGQITLASIALVIIFFTLRLIKWSATRI